MQLMVTTRAAGGEGWVRGLTAFVAVAGLMLAGMTADAAIRHRYSFGTDGLAEDSVGMADGTLMNGATVSGGELRLTDTGMNGQAAQHLSLLADGANGINIAGFNALTVEMWATTTNTNNWVRYFDIGSHNIIDQDPPNMDPAEGGFAGNSIFATVDAGGANTIRLAISNVDLSNIPSQAGFDDEQRVNVTPALQSPENVEHHIVFVFDDPNDAMQIYLNGLPLATSISSQPPGATSITHTLAALQDDGALPGLTDFALIGAALYGDDPWDGSFNEIRIYDMAASQGDVLASFARGPNGAAIPEPATALLLLAGLAGITCIRRGR
jgi:hypothetical protein